MTFEQQITKLCKEAVACQSQERAIELAREIQALMHGRIEELRGNLITLRPFGRTEDCERNSVSGAIEGITLPNLHTFAAYPARHDTTMTQDTTSGSPLDLAHADALGVIGDQN